MIPRCLLAVFVWGALAAPAAVRTGTVKAADGVPIVYDVRGGGTTTLLFVHCWSCDRTFWREQVDAFADRYRVVTLDLGGHGESGRGRSRWTIAGLAGDVKAVADKLKLERMILVGHSMGGPVSLEAARLLKGRVVGVVAVDTLHNAEQRIAAERVQGMVDKLKASFCPTIGGFMGSMFGEPVDPDLVAWVKEKSCKADPAVATALMLDFANVNAAQMFEAAGVPIRAINASPPHGAPTAAEVNRKHADYDVVLLDGAGHFLQLERSAEFNHQLGMIVEKLARQGAR
jgi:pimeloyl-ACP methyl ester carboxylesterase